MDSTARGRVTRLIPRRRIEVVEARLEPAGWTGNADSRDAFFVRQDRMLDPLLAWGLGNMIAGGAIAIAGHGLPRGIGMQAAAWGAINTVLVANWQCAARRHAVAARAGEMSAWTIQMEARRFEHIQALNSALGAALVAIGAVVALRSSGNHARGAGAGMVIQGSALLAYDLGLTLWATFRPETRFQGVDG